MLINICQLNIILYVHKICFCSTIFITWSFLLLTKQETENLCDYRKINSSYLNSEFLRNSKFLQILLLIKWSVHQRYKNARIAFQLTLWNKYIPLYNKRALKWVGKVKCRVVFDIFRLSGPLRAFVRQGTWQWFTDTERTTCLIGHLWRRFQDWGLLCWLSKDHLMEMLSLPDQVTMI